MKKYFKFNELIIYVLLIIGFTIPAFLLDLKRIDVALLIAQPLSLLGKLIRSIDNIWSPLAYVVYIMFSLTPLIYPVINILKTKKFSYTYLLWGVLSVFMFVFIYYGINPHLIKNIIFDSTEDYESVAFGGLTIILMITFALTIIIEGFKKQEQDEKKIYKYAQILLVVLIVFTLQDIFFSNIITIREEIMKLNEVSSLLKASSKALNLFVIILRFILANALNAFYIFIFIIAKKFVCDLQKDIFAVENIQKLNSLIKLSFISIIVSLGSLIIIDLVQFIFNKHLINVMYQANSSLVMLLVVCLLLIVAKILVRAIKINEENKLVI